MLEAQPPLFILEDSDEDFDTILEAAVVAGLTNDIRRATTGEGCLVLLRAARIASAVVLLDLSTPGLDGRETLLEIRRDPVLRDVPVVVLTTSSNPRDIAFCYRAGANAYHVKPVRYEDHVRVLLELLRYWLKTVVLSTPERSAC
jgi:CheY-like chemotaxis protein